MSNHKEYEIGIDFEKSPEYVKLFDESNKLMDDLNEFHLKLLSFRLYKNPFRNRKRLLNLISEYKKTIESYFDEWNNSAYNFIYHSKYVIRAEDMASHIVAAVQASNTVAIRVDQINTKGRDVKYDFYQLQNWAGSIKMAWYTYIALSVSMISLALGLISLFAK